MRQVRSASLALVATDQALACAVVEALRSRVQDPQKSIRAIARLLERHQQNLYTFLHRVHRKETIIEEFLQWAWCVASLGPRSFAR